MQTLKGEQGTDGEQLVGKAALVASVGGARGYADWTNPDHRLRRLLAEFIGMAGLTFVLSGGAARHGDRRPAMAPGPGPEPWSGPLRDRGRPEPGRPGPGPWTGSPVAPEHHIQLREPEDERIALADHGDIDLVSQLRARVAILGAGFGELELSSQLPAEPGWGTMRM